MAVARLALFICAVSSGSALAQLDLDSSYGIEQLRIERVAGSEVSLLDTGEGPPVLFYHPNNAIFEWQWMVESLSASHRVIVNGRLPEIGLPFRADALIQFLEALDVGPVHLVAHSFGGYQAMTLAAERPQLLRSLALVEPAGAPSLAGLTAQERDLQAGYRCDLPDVLKDSIEVDLFQCLLQVQANEPGFLQNAPVPLVRLVVENTRAARAAVGDEQLPLAVPGGWVALMPPICDELGDLELPLLFVRGELTPEIIQRNLDGYEDCLPPHRSVSIPDSAHYPHVYNPEAFVVALTAFFQRALEPMTQESRARP